jgi:putative transposase
MSIQFSQEKLRGERRREVIKAIQKQMQASALKAVSEVIAACLEEEVRAKLGREKGESRRISSQMREIDWQCANCGCKDANQFTRDGHYRRNLETNWGHIQNLPVPMLECQCCGHDVVCDYALLEKYHRFWLDLDQDVLWSTSCCQSVRDIVERWSATIGGSVGLRTINERINQIEPLVKKAHSEAIEEVPEVIHFDGIWMRLVESDPTVKPDKRKRARKRRKGRRVVVLVALGFDKDGRREILDWEIAKSEGHEEWEVLLNRLEQRGVSPEKGLKAVVRDGGGGLKQAIELVYGSKVIDQRCIFHKLQKVSKECRKELKGEDNKEKKKQMMQEASLVYEAESAEQARERLATWASTWREQAPDTVATFERDFGDTIVYYQLEGFSRELVRSTSLLERVNRQLRRKICQALSFGCHAGAEVALYLQIQRLHARWAHESWWDTSHNLSFDLDEVDP